MTASIAAVVVTFNRLAMLKECIAALRAQTRLPDEIIVIDNSSTDGTGDWLAQQADLTVHGQPNEGGAGGFYTGIRLAHLKGFDWFWCMDDDSIPEPAALQSFIANDAFDQPSTGFLASLVLWTDRTVHRMNAPWLRPPVRMRHHIMPFDAAEETSWLLEAASHRRAAVKGSSFVSMLVSRRAVDAVGLPLRRMFIWHDDAEFSARISRQFEAYLILDSIVIHKTLRNEAPNPLQAGKYRYSIRNMIVTLRADRAPLLLKLVRIGGFSTLTLLRVLSGKLGPGALYWLMKGFFFGIQPDFVTPPPAAIHADRPENMHAAQMHS